MVLKMLIHTIKSTVNYLHLFKLNNQRFNCAHITKDYLNDIKSFFF